MNIDIKPVPNWKAVLWKSWSVRFAAAGVLLPDLLQLAADNIEALPILDAGHKSLIRLACLAMVIICRPIQQAPMAPKAENDPQSPQ